ncbi:DUF2083 domain-containing protein [Gluconacetobacter azotocaptans]|uniref:DUF2083 domain-containing protein n=1 Tax=Gluconacetobacter azotocaptans TaxID=142834 RepID=A0A7W4PBZ1_9PROT|nr:helix-turn-helix transcriptional regulator [Gluconacetobacter azotocaptans]MBB2188652.1 DUF2083 domain-containing protein [Gluconacetobacter azotocaptans]MBM9400414.1 DUF2083 domain-containing protein [Gluconacetobacter azotocaptans]GBQ35218.1 XRE family transcriptional regulator [Gluconacetobacter azotocaptans DSM 13594]
MAPTRIGRIIRRLRTERSLSQQGLATRLGISSSYLNLIEHDQRSVTASLLIKLTRALDVSIETLSGIDEQRLEGLLQEALCDPLLGAHGVPAPEIAALAAQPDAARAVLTLHQAFRAAHHDATRLMLPTGTRVILPQEEARLVYDERLNYFSELEDAAERVRTDMAHGARLPDADALPPSESNHMIATRLRQHHGIVVRIAPLDGAFRRYDPDSRLLLLSDLLPRESRGFQLAFQLMLIEGRDSVERLLHDIAPSSEEARLFIRIGLVNYAAAALLMPYSAFLSAATALRYDLDILSARFGVSYQQAAQRLSTLQKPGERGVPFFFVRTDPAGNITKSFSACGFPVPRQGNSCPQWNANTCFSTPGVTQAQVAQFTDGRTFLCFSRTVTGISTGWNDIRPVHAVAMGCDITRAGEIVYSDRLNLQAPAIPVGISCHLCEWTECRSRAFPPLHHRLAPDINRRDSLPFTFSPAPPAGSEHG